MTVRWNSSNYLPFERRFLVNPYTGIKELKRFFERKTFWNWCLPTLYRFLTKPCMVRNIARWSTEIYRLKWGPSAKTASAHNHAVQAITSVKFWPNLGAKTWKMGQNTISWCSRKSLFFKIVFIGEYKLWQRSDIVAVEETWRKDDQRSENNQAGMEEPADCAKESGIGYTGCVIRRSSASCWFGLTSV